MVSSSLNASREEQMRKKQIWYKRKPILKEAYFTDLQNGSYVAAIYTIVQSIFMIILAIFDIYCLAEAQPGSTHYRYFGISFLFVYSGNIHVRNVLIMCSAISFFMAVLLLVTSVILMRALRKEIETKFRPWLFTVLAFTAWRLIAIFYRSIVNDLYFSYHQAMLVIWILFIAVNVFAWLVVMSNYQELEKVTKLEDMAKIYNSRMGTTSSLNASHSLSRHSVDSVKMQSTNTTIHSITPITPSKSSNSSNTSAA